MTEPDDPEFLADMLTEVIRHYIAIGSQAEREGRYDDAEAIYRDWMEKLPMDPRAKYQLSLLLLADGRYEEGFKLYEARHDIPELNMMQSFIKL